MHAAAVLKSPDLVHAVCQFQCGTYRDLVAICRLPDFIEFEDDIDDEVVAPVLGPWFAEYGATRLALLVRHAPIQIQRVVAMYAVHGEPLGIVQCLYELSNAVVTTTLTLDAIAAGRNRLDVLAFLVDVPYPVDHATAVLSAVTLGHFSAADMLVAHAPPCLPLDDDWSETLVNLVTAKQWALVDRLLPKFTREGAVLAFAAAVACGDMDRAQSMQSELGLADDLASTTGRGFHHAAHKCSLAGLQWIFSHWSAQISDQQRQDAECAYFRTAVGWNSNVDVVGWLADRVVCTSYETLEDVAYNMFSVHPNHVSTILAHVRVQGGRRFDEILIILAGYGRLDILQPMVDKLSSRLDEGTTTECMFKAMENSRLGTLHWLMSSGHVRPSDVRSTLKRRDLRTSSRLSMGDSAMLLAFRVGHADLVVRMHEMGVQVDSVVFALSLDNTNGVLSWLCADMIPQSPPPTIASANTLVDAPAMDATHPVLACVQRLVASRGGF